MWSNFFTRGNSEEIKIHDPVFGELIWDNKVHWWKAEARLDSDFPFAVYLIDYPKEADKDIEPYRRFFEMVRQNESAAREFAAEELLDKFNQYWSNGETITKEEFCRRMEPHSISISEYDDGEAEYNYIGEDLFGEHTICVSLNKSGVFTYASFEG